MNRFAITAQEFPRTSTKGRRAPLCAAKVGVRPACLAGIAALACAFAVERVPAAEPSDRPDPGPVVAAVDPAAQKPARIENASEGLTAEEVVPAAGQDYFINLSAALQLAESDNPTIARGREAVQEALALQLQARGLMLPTLNAGAMYHRHEGSLQAADGQIQRVDLQSLYFGGGSWTFASQTVLIPAVRIFGNLGDAIYAPLAAAQVVNSRNADARGVENSVLLEVARRYLDLLGAEATLEAVRRSEDNLREVVSATAAFARAGQGRMGDYHRARTDALLLHSREMRIQETVAVASAELARTLHLDPSIRLKAGPGALETIQLVDPGYRVEELIELAQSARPETAARSADIAAADLRLKQECVRPFLPILSVGFSAGGFGGGSTQVDSFFQRAAGRTDFDAYAVWSLDNLGFGNAALQSGRRAERDVAVARRTLLLNQIGREVADAFAQSRSWQQQLELTQRRLTTAVDGAREEINRTRNGVGLPLEAINSVDLLVEARNEVIAAVIGYDMAQFQLFVALGETPQAALPDPHRAGAHSPADH